MDFITNWHDFFCGWLGGVIVTLIGWLAISIREHNQAKKRWTRIKHER
jgi:hypothetical protein